MNTTSLEVIGTFQGCWNRWIKQAISNVDIHANVPGALYNTPYCEVRSNSKVLALVEHPALGLAHALLSNDDLDPEAWLDDWTSSALALIAYAKCNPNTTLVVNAVEAQRRPRRLTRMLALRWAHSHQAPSRLPVTHNKTDPLAHALALGIVHRHAALLHILQEAMALCVALPGTGHLTGVATTDLLVDNVDAAHRLAELLKAEQTRPQPGLTHLPEQEALGRGLHLVTPDHATSTAAMNALEVQRDALATRLEDAEAALSAAHSRLDAESQEHELLKTRLKEAEARLASSDAELQATRSSASALGRQVDEARTALGQSEQNRLKLERELSQVQERIGLIERDLAKEVQQRRVLVQDLAHLDKQRMEATQELDKATKQRDSLRDERASLDRKIKTLEQKLSKEKESLRDAKEENQLLLQQLHRVQERLEQLSLSGETLGSMHSPSPSDDQSALEKDVQRLREECELLTLQNRQVQQELERLHSLKPRTNLGGLALGTPGTLADISIGELTVVSERDTPPHREISFVIRNVRARERHIPQAVVRLVEHWGRPGLVVFGGELAPQLFEAWRESGREDNRPYMLLVHGEESAQQIYDAMGTLDWQLALTLASSFVQALQPREGAQYPAWQTLAHRLLASLQEQPARLRYNRVTAQQEIASLDHPIHFALEGASFHGRAWARLPITWRPYGTTRSLELRLDASSAPPLLAWPTTADGKPAESLQLPLDPNALEDSRSNWRSLAGSDRELVLELLNLMPTLSVHLANGDSAKEEELQAAATEATQCGRASLFPSESPQQPAARSRLLQRISRHLRSVQTPNGKASVAVAHHSS